MKHIILAMMLSIFGVVYGKEAGFPQLPENIIRALHDLAQTKNYEDVALYAKTADEGQRRALFVELNKIETGLEKLQKSCPKFGDYASLSVSSLLLFFGMLAHRMGRDDESTMSPINWYYSLNAQAERHPALFFISMNLVAYIMPKLFAQWEYWAVHGEKQRNSIEYLKAHELR